MDDVFTYGYDTWFYIFEKCPSFQLRVLKSVCKTLYHWLENNDYIHKLYYKSLRKEHQMVDNKIIGYDLPFSEYFEIRRFVETDQLCRLMSSQKYVIFNCDNEYSVPLKNELNEHLHLKGLLIIGYRANNEIKIEIGGNVIDAVDSSHLTYDISCYKETLEATLTDNEIENLLYYPLFQSGSLPIPKYHLTKIYTDNTKVYLFGEYKKKFLIQSGNIMNSGNIDITPIPELIWNF